MNVGRFLDQYSMWRKFRTPQKNVYSRNLQWIHSFLCASNFIDMVRFGIEEHSVPVRKLLNLTGVNQKRTFIKEIWGPFNNP